MTAFGSLKLVRTLFPGAFLTLAVMVLAGCSAGMRGGGDIPQKLYIDATRHFAVEFPGNWNRFLSPDDRALPDADAVGWEAPETSDGHPVARMRVVIPHTPLALPTVKEKISENLPGFVMTQSEPTEVFDRAGLEMRGHTPQRLYAIVLIGAEEISYLLVYSAHPDEFDRYRPRFKEMVASFEILP